MLSKSDDTWRIYSYGTVQQAQLAFVDKEIAEQIKWDLQGFPKQFLTITIPNKYTGKV